MKPKSHCIFQNFGIHTFVHQSKYPHYRQSWRRDSNNQHLCRYNVMVTRPTNHMISTRDLSGHQVNIKSSSISTSASSFLYHDYIRVIYSARPRYVYILVSSSLQHLSSAYRGPRVGARWSPRKTTSRL